MLSQRDLTTTFAENLLKQFETDDVDSKVKLHESINSDAMINNNHSGVMTRNMKSPPVKCEATSTSAVTSALLNKHEIKDEPVIKIEKLLEYEYKPVFSNDMVSKEIHAAVK